MSTDVKELSDNDIEETFGEITITSPYENVIATCYKVLSSNKMYGGKSSPQYALYGVSKGFTSFWGEPTTFLGWYADKEHLSKEISEIQNALSKGIKVYTLKYSSKTEKKWAKVKIIK